MSKIYISGDMAPLAILEYSKNNLPTQIRATKSRKPRVQAVLDRMQKVREKTLEKMRKARDEKLAKAKQSTVVQ
jgi:hypothetical protein